jgi:hypothetical protein
MIGFIVTSLQLQSIITAHTLNSFWTFVSRLISDWSLPLWSLDSCTPRIQSQSHSQSVSQGVEPHLGLMTRYLSLFDSYGLVLVGRPLWREDGSVFSICCWPCHRSLSRVRVPWDSRPYFTVSDLRLPFSSPPTTRRVTVEVFDPASTRVGYSLNSRIYCLL